MSKLSKSLPVLLLLLPLFLWGYVFEFSYFSQIGIPVPKEMNIVHFAIAGGMPLLLTVVLYIALFSIMSLFSKNMLKANDDKSESLEKIRATEIFDNYKNSKNYVRIGLLFSTLYFVIVFFEINLGGDFRGAYLYMIYVQFFLFARPIIAAHRDKFISVFTLFLISMCFIYGAGGTFYSRGDLEKSGIIRDDSRVEITKTENGFDVKVKKMNVLTAWKLIAN